jgi:hypothetical protein
MRCRSEIPGATAARVLDGCRSHFYVHQRTAIGTRSIDRGTSVRACGPATETLQRPDGAQRSPAICRRLPGHVLLRTRPREEMTMMLSLSTPGRAGTGPAMLSRTVARFTHGATANCRLNACNVDSGCRPPGCSQFVGQTVLMSICKPERRSSARLLRLLSCRFSIKQSGKRTQQRHRDVLFVTGRPGRRTVPGSLTAQRQTAG